MTDNPAPNAYSRTVIEYGLDPRGAGMFAALNSAILGGLTSARAVVPTAPHYDGWVKTTQQFAGATAFLGRARTVAPKNSTLTDQKTTDDVVASSIFRERMARGLG